MRVMKFILHTSLHMVAEFIPLSLHHVPLSLRLTSPLSLFHPASKMAGQKKRQQMKNMQKREQKAIKAKIVMRRITHQISSVEEGRERERGQSRMSFQKFYYSCTTPII